MTDDVGHMSALARAAGLQPGATTARRLGRLKALYGRIADRIETTWAWTTSSRPILRSVQRPYLIIMPIVFAGAVGIGAAILPGEEERIAALERDGQPARALMLLEARFAKGDRSSTTLFNLQRLYDFFGDTEKGRSALEQLAAQRPRDPVIQRQLAQLYKATQDEPAYVKALQTQLALRYSEPVCRELIGLHRRGNDYEAEHATLKACRASGYRRSDDLVRLAFLEMADERMGEVAQIMLSVDDRRRLAAGRERLLLFASLLDTKRPEEAVRRATRWLRASLDPELAIEFAYKLVDANRNDLALQLATAVSKPGDAVSLTVGEIMVDKEEYTAARAFLTGWLQQNKAMDLELAIRFVSAGLDCDEPALAMRGAEQFGLDKLDQPELGRLAEMLMARGLGPTFDRVRTYLQPETVLANPLLAAGVELRAGRLEQARAILVRVQPDRLDDRRLDHFTRLVDQAGRTPALAAVLREPRVVAPLPAPGARPLVLGPAQAKQRILKRAVANKQLRAKQRAKNAQPGATPAPTSAPFPFPSTSQQ
jgi:tetratricopeptide (TPR) repeat protein